jgi:hypothetical protein
MTFKVPKTLNRFRPAGAWMKIRVDDPRKPRNGDGTKWAALTKKMALSPVMVSSKGGCNSFFNRP